MYRQSIFNHVVSAVSLRRVIQWFAIVLVSFSLLACSGAGHKTGAYIDDSMITTKVKSKLLATKQVSGMSVNVETHKGVVQLSGFVKSEKERNIAVAVAKDVKGVRKVINSIQVK